MWGHHSGAFCASANHRMGHSEIQKGPSPKFKRDQGIWKGASTHPPVLAPIGPKGTRRLWEKGPARLVALVRSPESAPLRIPFELVIFRLRNRSNFNV